MSALGPGSPPSNADIAPEMAQLDAPPAEPPPRNHVLVIGIDGYAIRPLRGCVNDALAMREVLEKRFGVRREEIVLLASPSAGRVVDGASAATIAAIRSALDGLASDAVGPGDRVIIYYSGHGASRTVAGAGTRHWVECLIPADFDPAAVGPLLYDAEINQKLAAISRRTTNITVILDCCHSAGATRAIFDDDAVARTMTLPPLDAPPGTAPVATEPPAERTLSLASPRAVRRVTVAACLADESALETTAPDGSRHGIFTRALLKELDTAESPHLAWTEIWLRLLSQTRPRQNPSFAGDDRHLLFGELRAIDRGELFVTPEGAEYRIAAGTLVDVTVGTQIAVYGAEPATLPTSGAAETRARVATLTVQSAAPTEARATPDKPFRWPPGARCRAVRFGEPVLRVAFSGVVPEALVERLNRARGIRVVDDDIATVRLVREGTEWLVCDDIHGRRADGRPELVRCGDADLEDVLDVYLRYEAPLRLARRSTDLPGALRVRLLDASRRPADPQAPFDLAEMGGLEGFRFGLRIGEPFAIVIDNLGSTALRSVSLLNCASSGRVQHISSCVLPAQGTHAMWQGDVLGEPFELKGPPGVERLVAIGSTRPDLDWRFLESDRGFRDGRTRDFGKGAGALVRDLYSATTCAIRVVE